MHFVEKEPSQKRSDLVKKLKTNKILRVPGAYNPLTAKLIEEIGYDAVYVSGGVMANDLGFPDIGLTSLQDVSTRSYLISRVTSLPTIVDIDTGFKSCEETIKTFEEFGVARGDRFVICSGSDSLNADSEATAQQAASALAVNILMVVPGQCQSSMCRQFFYQKIMKRFTALGVPPCSRVLMPSVMKASTGSRQPELLCRRLPTKHKDHAVTEGGVDHALCATDIDIIR